MLTTILVAEPDECIADDFSKALSARGFEVLTATNERDCIRYLCESALDVVVLEPDVIGSWGRRVLLNPVGRTPLVVVSRFSRHDSIRDQEVQWLTKPISTGQLFDAVTFCLSKASEQRVD